MLKGLGALAAGTALAACSSSSQEARTPTTAASTTLPTLDHHHVAARSASRDRSRTRRMPDGTDTMPQIEHIVVLMMENHSYDDHFGMLKRGDGFKLGADGLPLDANLYTDRASCSRRSTCRRPASSTGIPARDWNTSHTVVRQRPQRRVREGQRPGRDGLLGRAPTFPSTTASRETFPLADRWFCSVLAQTYPNRRFLVAGTAARHHQHRRQGARSPRAPPNGTIFERLDAHGITWLNYYNDLPAGSAVIPTVLGKHPKQRRRRRASSSPTRPRASCPSFSYRRPQLQHPVGGGPAGHPPG